MNTTENHTVKTIPAYLKYESDCATAEREIASREVIEDEFTPLTEDAEKTIVLIVASLSR